MGFAKSLRCRECGMEYPKEPLFVCEECFGPLEVVYDYERVRRTLTKEAVSARPDNMWRYRELLPLDGEPSVGLNSGFTPLVKADNLAKVLEVRELYVKDDSVCHPTLSFKDRVVSVAVSKAKEFGFNAVACVSTGNLANSVAANAAIAGLKAYVFVPADLEAAKVLSTLVYGPKVIAVKGTYDEANRLCAEIASKYGWAFVNINLRPYYAEGSKTYAYEIAEQMGWRVPDHIVVPCAGGSLISKIWKAFCELHEIGFIERPRTKVHAAQAAGCCPIVAAIKDRSEFVRPVRPKTIAKSLAIGNPADGYYAKQAVEQSGGWAEVATDDEIIEAMKLLAETEGIFTETAGGVTVAVTQKLVKQGIIAKDESVVISITGNGLKTQEVLYGRTGAPVMIEPSLRSFEDEMKGKLWMLEGEGYGDKS